MLLTEDVFYLALCDKKFPAKLAFGYLDDLRKEFESVHGQQVASARSVYSMQKFEPYISRAKKVFSDFRSQKDLEQVNSDLSEVHNVMKRSIQEVLGRGEKLSGESKRWLWLSRPSAPVSCPIVRVCLCMHFSPLDALCHFFCAPVLQVLACHVSAFHWHALYVAEMMLSL